MVRYSNNNIIILGTRIDLEFLNVRYFLVLKLVVLVIKIIISYLRTNKYGQGLDYTISLLIFTQFVC